MPAVRDIKNKENFYFCSWFMQRMSAKTALIIKAHSKILHNSTTRAKTAFDAVNGKSSKMKLIRNR